MKKLVILFTILIIPPFSFAEEKMVVRFTEPYKVILSEFLTEIYDIAAYKPGMFLDIVINRNEYEDLLRRGFDVQITQTEAQLKKNLEMRAYRTLSGYRTYDDLLVELQEIESQYPDICRIYDIGESWGKIYSNNGLTCYADYHHEVWALKVSDNVAIEEDEPSVYYMGVHHAREPISLEVPLAILHYILDKYETDPTITANVNNTQIWFIPLINPNGHRLVTQQIDMWWRKNIRDNSDDGQINTCDGVDPNRNYGFKWGDIGASDSPCSEVYHGPNPWSEPEIQAIKNLSESHHFVAGISYHSYGELVLFPFGYNWEVYAPDHDALEELAVMLASTIPAEGGGHYIPTEAWRLYPAMGNSDDYTYGVHGIFAFTIELGTQLIPPASQIDELCNDNIEAAMILLNRVNHSTLTGNITDAETHEPIVAEIFVEGIDDTGAFRHPYKSDKEFGRYYRLLQTGSYNVTFSAEGYKRITFENIIINPNDQTILDVALNPEVTPDIKANGQDDPISVTPAENVNLTISLSPGDRAGDLADWWLVILTLWRPFLIPLGQFPLFELPEISLSSLTLPEGIYGFVFALDDKPDGIFGVTWLDLVIVVSQAQGREIEEIPHFDGIFMEKMKELIRQ